MDFVKFSIEKPVSVLVGVILLVLFGGLALSGLPYQLSPSVTEPEITVETSWTGATPYEIERDIIEEQEKVLKGVTGLMEMESECFDSFGRISLRFKIGTNIDDALLRVSNKLNEVKKYPSDSDRPVISATGASASPVIWMILRTLPDNKHHINEYATYFEDDVRQYLERVDGVADLFVGGGTENEMHIIIAPEKLAAYNLTIDKVTKVLQSENANVSAGNLGVGRRDYRIRTTSEFKTPEEIESVVITSSGQQRVTIGDVGKVVPGFEKQTVSMLHNGIPGMAIGVKPEPGSNVLEVTKNVRKVVEDLNAEVLADKGIFLDWVYDQAPYINGAIDLVKQNIIIGGVLAVIVLLIFLQSFSATIIVAIAIPISVVGSFIVFGGLGRTLNIVSMSGISFAVGMLVDNAIVVLENIDRHRGMGKRPYNAAYDGASEVWGAVLASTLTTVAVFLPVVFIEEEAGQLFKDIAIAVTCAISLSMFVSISVIPMLAKQFYSLSKRKKKVKKNILTGIGAKFSDAIMGLLSLAIRNWVTRLSTVAILVAASALLVISFFPKMEYLPQGNRNLVLSILIPPPGLSFEERDSIGEYIAAQTKPHMEAEKDGFPQIESLFYVSAPDINLFGAISKDEDRPAAMIPLFNRIMNSIPGMFGVSIQASIFETGLGKGRMVAVDFSGPELPKLMAAAGTMFGMAREAIPGGQVRPIPSLEMLYPEVRIVPDRDRLRAAGMSSQEIGEALDVLMDGRKIGDYKEEGKKKIDLKLMASGKRVSTPEDLYESLVATPQGWAVPVSSLSHLERTYGITQIRHLERQRTVTLQITPPKSMPLEQAMDIVQNQLIPKVKEMGLMDGVNVRMSGAADKLTQTREAMQWNFLLAVVITYLLMAALFGNFIYPFIILLTVPLAGAGGFLGLKLENLFIAPQPLDVLTMLGFVILIGVVVNNAILIVHQSLNNVRNEGMEHREAVLEATRSRLRPIYMSATTSIFGMLPLAIAPGPGSELYRGLGAVVLGGLALSTVFTVFMIPALLMFFIKMEKIGGGEVEA
ncbi:efflux RND transporter permease subunit [Maridesulfovibrio salexigens]|uniref:Acriflavin resistance protein n=1 Tax=Maridesulfovibrio salexigens (strain ATCC 14822 / DSM 2638 / NCIMB 8403 / VKM B-1763) TaxID=526222 RepID=C6C0M6_MARSD|nr:efflux RND transporter permease subunit [Maridesulfovibrio salexigens]ACS79160.1 acriflavin resistance protein [Maridesulfovibrio salexigens DSM 2638]